MVQDFLPGALLGTLGGAQGGASSPSAASALLYGKENGEQNSVAGHGGSDTSEEGIVAAAIAIANSTATATATADTDAYGNVHGDGASHAPVASSSSGGGVQSAKNAFIVPVSLKRRATRAKIALVMGQAFKEKMGAMGGAVEEDEEEDGEGHEYEHELGEGGAPRPSVHAARRTGMAIEREVSGVTTQVRRVDEGYC